MEKQIRIKAVCPFFEISEEVPEKKAENRLKQIKSWFVGMKQRHEGSGTMFGKKRFHGKAKLTVTTTVANPSLL